MGMIRVGRRRQVGLAFLLGRYAATDFRSAGALPVLFGMQPQGLSGWAAAVGRSYNPECNRGD